MVGEAAGHASGGCGAARAPVVGADAFALLEALSDLGPVQLASFTAVAAQHRDAALRRDPHTARAWACLADLATSIPGDAPKPAAAAIPPAVEESGQPVARRRRRRRHEEDDVDDYGEYGGEGG